MVAEGKHLAMEGGKHFSKFATDGLQMVYRAAEKQTKEYIASKSSVADKKESSSIGVQKSKDSGIEPISSTPFYAASDAGKNVEKAKPKASMVADDSPEPFFAARADEERDTKKTPSDEKTKHVGNDSPNVFFAAIHEDHGRSQLQKEAAGLTNDETSPGSTSSLLRSGGRMFAKFVGDGLQMVQRVAQKDKR